MSDERVVQLLTETGIKERTTCPKVFAVMQKAKVSSVEPGKHRSPHTIRISHNQLGCFP